MQKIDRRRGRAGSFILAVAGLLFVHGAVVPVRAHATALASASLSACLLRVGTLQVVCLLNASTSSPQAARVATARLCQQTLQARLQVCNTRATASSTKTPPTQAALSAPPDTTSPTVTTDKFEYSSGNPLVISGSGWQTNERITLVVQVTPATHANVQFFAVADEDGNFTSRAYTVQASDAGATLSVTATGRAGGTAQTAAFVDPPATAQGAKGAP